MIRVTIPTNRPVYIGSFPVKLTACQNQEKIAETFCSVPDSEIFTIKASFDFFFRSLRLLWQDEVKGSQLRLQRSATQRSLSIICQLHKVIFSTHPCYNLGLIQHGPDTQWGCTGILKALARFQYGLSTSNTRTLDDILIGATNCLNLEST